MTSIELIDKSSRPASLAQPNSIKIESGLEDNEPITDATPNEPQRGDRFEVEGGGVEEDGATKPWFAVYRPAVRGVVEEILKETRFSINLPEARRVAIPAVSSEYDFEVLNPQSLTIFKEIKEEFIQSLESFSCQYFRDRANIKESTKHVRLVLPAKAPVVTVLKVCITRIPPAFEALAPMFTNWQSFRCRMGRLLWRALRSDLGDRLKRSLFNREDLDVEVVFNMKTGKQMNDEEPIPLTGSILYEILWTLMPPSGVAMADFCSSRNFQSKNDENANVLDDYFLKHLCQRIIYLVDRICKETTIKAKKRTREEEIGPDGKSSGVKKLKIDGSSPVMDNDPNNITGGLNRGVTQVRGSSSSFLSAADDGAILIGMYGLRPNVSGKLDGSLQNNVASLVEAASGGYHASDQWPLALTDLTDLLSKLDAPDIVRLRKLPAPAWSMPHYSDLDRMCQVLECAMVEKERGQSVSFRRSDGYGKNKYDLVLSKEREDEVTGQKYQVETTLKKLECPIKTGGFVNPLIPAITRWRIPQSCPFTGNGFVIPPDPSLYLESDHNIGAKGGNRLMPAGELSDIVAKIVRNKGGSSEETLNDEDVHPTNNGTIDRTAGIRIANNVGNLLTTTNNIPMNRDGVGWMSRLHSSSLDEDDWQIIKKTLGHMKASGEMTGLKHQNGLFLRLGPLRDPNPDLGDPPAIICEPPKKKYTGRRGARGNTRCAKESGGGGEQGLGIPDLNPRIWSLEIVRSYLANPEKMSTEHERAYLIDKRNAELCQLTSNISGPVYVDLSDELKPSELDKKKNS